MADPNRDVFSKDGVVLTATTTINLGNAAENIVSRFLVWLIDESSQNFSTVVNKGAFGSSQTKVAGSYATENAPDTIVAGSTPITAMGIYIIEALGMDVDLVCTRTGGSMRVIARKIKG